jgi:hypothetical protein
MATHAARVHRRPRTADGAMLLEIHFSPNGK